MSGISPRMRIRRRAALLLPACLLWARPSAAGDDLLAAVMAGLAQVPVRRSIFQEEKTLAAVDGVLRSSGTLLYRRPGHLEKRTLDPEAELLVVDGQYLSITAGQDAPRVVDLDRQPELRALVDTVRAPLAGDLPTLERLFQVRADGSMAAWRLSLSPAPRLARFVRAVTIDGAGAEVRSIDVVQANGDEQRMTIQPAP
jgi:hypothetical protein